DRIERTPNTLDAHRLIGLAERQGVQDAVVEALFRAYLTEGRSAQVLRQSYYPGNLAQNRLEKRWSVAHSGCHVVRFFVCAVLQSYQFGVFPPLPWGCKKRKGLPPEKIGGPGHRQPSDASGRGCPGRPGSEQGRGRPKRGRGAVGDQGGR